MADNDRTGHQILFWHALLEQLLASLGDVLTEDHRALARGVMVRLSLENPEEAAQLFPLWDLRPVMLEISDRLNTDEAPNSAAAQRLASSYVDVFADQLAAALADDGATAELAAYAEPVDDAAIAQFDAIGSAFESAEAEEEAESTIAPALFDGEPPSAEDEFASDLERELAELGQLSDSDFAADASLDADLAALERASREDAPATAAPSESSGLDPEFELEAPSFESFDELPALSGLMGGGHHAPADASLLGDPLSDLLPGAEEVLGGLEEAYPATADPLAGFGLPGLDASSAGLDEAPDDDSAVLSQLENMDLSSMGDGDVARLLAQSGGEMAGLEEDVPLEAPSFDSFGFASASLLPEDAGGAELGDDLLANLEQELEGAEAAASQGSTTQPVEEPMPQRMLRGGARVAAITSAEAQMTPQDLVRARMIRISEAVEELSDNPADRMLLQQLIDHFAVITRPITRMGFRTFASLSDALVSALEFSRDNDLEAPPLLCNNLRELVTTLAEVVDGRWSKYKTFYWLINKLNTTIRHMEEMVSEREEQRLLGGFASAADIEEAEEQIGRRKEEVENRQRQQLTDLQEIFVQEANEHIDLLNRNLLLIERHPNDAEIIYALMRSAHSIKGSANISKFPKIAELGHVMEDVMVAVRDNGLTMASAIIDVMLHSVDRLQAMIANVEYAQEYDEKPIEELKAKLRQLAEELQAHPEKYKASGDVVDAELQKKVGLKVERKQTDAAQDSRSEAEKQANTVRVDYENLNLLLNQAAELVINRTRLSGQIDTLRGMIESLNHEKKKLRTTEQRLDRAIEEVSVEMTGFLNTGRALSQSAGMGGMQTTETQAMLSRLAQTRQAMSRLLRIHESGMLGDFSEAEFDRFSEFDIIWRDLREGVTHLNDMVDHFESVSSNLDQNVSRISLIANDLHEQIMRIRMIPVSRIFNRFPRTIRDIARQLDKKIALHVEGEETPLDKTIIEDLTDPMIHLVRNACDHGIESPAEREEMSKPPEGTISLIARQEGNQVIIIVRDDGKGIDLEAIKRKAVERRIMNEEQVNRASEGELMNLIFAPGFSTAAKTTDISGRGVGMDVVRTAITKLKGTIAVQSELGEGTTFTIRLPLTLAISQALLFTASGSRFAIQLSAVDEAIMVREDAIMRTLGSEIIKLRKEVLPIIRLNHVLSLGAPEEGGGERPVVIINAGGNRRIGVVVDRLVGREEVVVKNLGNHLRNVPFVSGGTILGDGAVTLILDILDIVDQAKPTQLSGGGIGLDDSALAGVDMDSYRQAVEARARRLPPSSATATTPRVRARRFPVHQSPRPWAAPPSQIPGRRTFWSPTTRSPSGASSVRSSRQLGIASRWPTMGWTPWRSSAPPASISSSPISRCRACMATSSSQR